MDFIDQIWQHIYEDKSVPSTGLRQQLIHESGVKGKIHNWMNSDRDGGWVMATIEPQKEGFYQTIDADNKRGKHHFYYGKWQSVDGKKIVKWFDTNLNKKPCPSCKVHEYDNEQLTAKLKVTEEAAADLKRDINFKLTHILVRDEVLTALEKANDEIERLKSLTGCNGTSSLDNIVKKFHETIQH